MTDQELNELEQRVADALDVPEPSPLFWEHFPNRVRAAIAAEPPRQPVWWRRRALVFALSIAVVGGLSSWGIWNAARAGAGSAGVPDTIAEAQAPASGDIELLDETSGDAGWDVVSSVAASAGIETVREAGFGVAPGGAEMAIESLSDTERAELVALLRAEMSGDAGGL